MNKLKSLLLTLVLASLTTIKAVKINKHTPPKWTHETISAVGEYTGFDGGDGIIAQDLGAATTVTDMIVSLDGNYIYVCGSLHNGSYTDMMVTRFRKNTYNRYELDSSWGTSGSGWTFAGFENAASANRMALRTYTDVDGTQKEEQYIYLIGTHNSKFAYSKIDKNNGSVSFYADHDLMGTDAAHDVAVDDTYLYVVGTHGSYIKVTKYLKSSGASDTDFGSSGIVTLTDGTIGYTIKLKSGDLYIGGTDGADIVLAKFKASDGSLYDGTAATPGWGDSGSGVVIKDLGGTDIVYDMVLTDDSIVGVGTDEDNNKALAVKYRLSDGVLMDGTAASPEFGASGILEMTGSIAWRIKKLGSYFYSVGTSNGGNFMVVKFDGNGNFDTTFNTDGQYTVDMGGTDEAKGIGFLPDVPGNPIVATGDTVANYVKLVAFNNDVSGLDYIQDAYKSAAGLA